MRAARRDAVTAERLLSAGRTSDGLAALRRVRSRALYGADRLDGGVLGVAAHTPILGRPIRSARVLLQATARAAEAGSDLESVDPSVMFSGGVVRVDAFGPALAAVGRAHARLAAAAVQAERSPAWPLPSLLVRERAELIQKLRASARTAAKTLDALRVLPGAAGAQGVRRYEVFLQTPTELRGTGGLIGSYAVLRTDRGRLSLEEVGRPHPSVLGTGEPGPADYQARYARFGAPDISHSLNMSPDFATVARIAAANARRGSIGNVDGVIAVDPFGLQALLQIAGPVRVPSWPAPITAGNVVAITTHDMYAQFGENEERYAFVAQIAGAAIAKLPDARIDARAGATLGRAIAAKRIQIWTPDLKPEPLGDVALVTQNAAANKLDAYLRRSLDVRVTLRPNGSADVSVAAELLSEAPTEGPRYIIGPNAPGFAPGESRQLTSIYLPGGSTVSGLETGEIQTELGRTVVTKFLRLLPGEPVVLRVRANVPKVWNPRTGELLWRVSRQPAMFPDAVRLRFEAPERYAWIEAPGAALDGGVAGYTLTLDADVRLELRLRRKAL